MRPLIHGGGLLALLAAAVLLATPARGAGCGQIIGWAAGIPLCAALVPVPDVRGLSLTDADTSLEAVGLVTGDTTPRCSSAEANTVLRQTPRPGRLVAIGTAIDLLYSSGEPCPETRKPVQSLSIDIGIRL